LEPGSKITDIIESPGQKHPAEIASISALIRTSRSGPKYRIRRVSQKSTRKSHETLKQSFPSSTVTLLIPEPTIAKPISWRAVAGIRID
jgi:hypothetical protein